MSSIVLCYQQFQVREQLTVVTFSRIGYRSRKIPTFIVTTLSHLTPGLRTFSDIYMADIHGPFNKPHL